MGASNFGRTNLPSGIIYAFAMQEDDECDTSIDYDYVIEEVKNKITTSCYAKEEWIDRTTKIIGYVNVTLYNKESKEWEDGSINVLVEHGYYEGARLDISLDDLIDNFPPLNKSQTALINREIARIEKVFAEVCGIKLRKVGSFSNGEGVYETV